MANRKQVADFALSYLGTKQGDSRHKEILNYYNKLAGTSFGINTFWCCIFTVFVLKKCGVDIPITASCGDMINKCKKLGIWEENDDHLADVADAIIYDWNDSGKGDNTTGHEHIGVITAVNGDSWTVTEGNYSNSVKNRTVIRDQVTIRGYICPKYDTPHRKDGEPTPKPTKSITDVAKEVIDGKWGNNPSRKALLISYGYNYDAVQAEVNNILSGKKPESTKKSTDVIAREVIAGKWGNGTARKTALKNAGYDPDEVQKKVNSLLENTKR